VSGCTVISGQRSAVSYQLSAVSGQRSAVSGQLSAVSYQLCGCEGVSGAQPRPKPQLLPQPFQVYRDLCEKRGYKKRLEKSTIRILHSYFLFLTDFPPRRCV